ncbi:MAG: PH domain-containing protein [Bryobacteraceae bacterium]|jgi:PH (Pleckstrin Homology) domain-containing protein
MREFRAPYDTGTKVISVVVCVLLLGMAILLRVVFADVLIPLLLLLAYAYSPRGYAIESGSLAIKRLIGNIRVPLESLREVRAGTSADFTGTIRLAGNGGLFGYYGLFRTAALGKSSWYVTDRSRTVIVKTDSKTFVLSPDDVTGFLDAVGVRRAAGSPNAAPQSSSRTGMVVGMAVALLAAAFIGFALLYSPGIPGYTFANGSLTIHDQFYPVTLPLQTIDVPRVKVADLTQDPEWRPTLRINGFANQHYQSGWYRVANGKNLRLYRAGGDRLVLIPRKDSGTYVLYQARDPHQFIEQLQQAASTGAPR